MPRAYSRDLRERLLAALDAGLSADEIERTMRISRRSLRRWRAQRAATGDLTPGRPSGRPRTVTADHDRQLLTQVTVHPDWTLAQHATALAAATGVAVSAATVSRRFNHAGITLKKSP
jgi:transposase